nr:hypothetical protein [Oscillospiraceae bacterium]
MNAVAYFSCTGESKKIAEHLAGELDFNLFEIREIGEWEIDNLVLAFPVHCQNIPEPVKDLLCRVRIKNLTVLATYGRMCSGNVLYEIGKKYNSNIVAAAYIPTKHSYLEEKGFSDFDRLAPLIEKIKSPSKVKLPKLYKNPLADLLPVLRSRVGVKMIMNENCDGCGMCTDRCNFGGIKNGVINTKCVRCLKCVANCPKGALSYRTRLPLKIYLNKKKNNKLIIYT